MCLCFCVLSDALDFDKFVDKSLTSYSCVCFFNVKLSVTIVEALITQICWNLLCVQIALPFFFDVLLTVKLSMILAINQLNAQNLLL